VARRPLPDPCGNNTERPTTPVSHTGPNRSFGRDTDRTHAPWRFFGLAPLLAPPLICDFPLLLNRIFLVFIPLLLLPLLFPSSSTPNEYTDLPLSSSPAPVIFAAP